MKKITFDDSMGAAGDMIAGALLDLFDDPQAAAEELNKIIKDAGLEEVVVEIAQKINDDVEGMDFDVNVDGNEERVDHWDESDHHHYEDEYHRHEHPHYHDDHRPRRPHRMDRFDHDHRYEDHFDHDHRRPEHFERFDHHRRPEHRHPHFDRCDHDHRPRHMERCGREHRERCHRPEEFRPPFVIPGIKIEGPIKISFNLHFGETEKPKKHRHHRHHHRGHRDHRTPRPSRKARMRDTRKRSMSMKTGKDHLK